MNAGSRTLLVALAVVGGCLWYGAGRQATITPAEPEFTVTGPFTHDNLTVFLLHGPDTARPRPVLGLDEALAAGVAIVHETGSVNELAVENTSSDADLLLLSGDIVKGGRQDRVLQATAILPPNSGRVPVRSFCVEHNRWTGRAGQDAGRFAANPGQIGGKELKKAVQLSGDQGAVWNNVTTQQGALTRNLGAEVNSPDSPSSLQLALENDRVQAEVAKYREAITGRAARRPDVIGFVTVVNGQVTGAEAFGSHALFEKAWAKAVTAAAVEAVAEKTDRPFAELSVGDVRTFLADASSGRQNSERERWMAAYASEMAAVQFAAGMITQVDDGGGDLTVRDAIPLRGHGAAEDRYGRGGTADVITEVNNLVEAEPAGNPDGTVERVRVWREMRNRGRAENRSIQTQADILPAVPVRVQSRVLTEANRSLTSERDRAMSPAQPQSAPKAAVVEYREKGNGAVIHRSFLPK